MALIVKFAGSGVQNSSVPVQPSLQVCQGLCSVPFTCCPHCPFARLQTASFAALGWSCATAGRGRDGAGWQGCSSLSCDREAAVEPTGLNGRCLVWAADEPPSLSSWSDFHPQYPWMGKPRFCCTQALHIGLGAWCWASKAWRFWKCKGLLIHLPEVGTPQAKPLLVHVRKHPQQHPLCEPRKEEDGWDSQQYSRREFRAATRQHGA